jgi:Stress responsive A/B Barrel Domain
MIRNFALLKLKSDTRPDQVNTLIEAMRRLTVPGMSGLTVHRDAALRPGNSDVVIVCDLEDEEAYRRYDSDEEHNRIRSELVAPITERVERIQVRI